MGKELKAFAFSEKEVKPWERVLAETLFQIQSRITNRNSNILEALVASWNLPLRSIPDRRDLVFSNHMQKTLMLVQRGQALFVVFKNANLKLVWLKLIDAGNLLFAAQVLIDEASPYLKRTRTISYHFQTSLLSKARYFLYIC